MSRTVAPRLEDGWSATLTSIIDRTDSVEAHHIVHSFGNIQAGNPKTLPSREAPVNVWNRSVLALL